MNINAKKNIFKKGKSLNLKNLETLGVIFIFVICKLLKIIGEIFTINVLMVIFGPVNNSCWEEIKIFTFYFLIWGAIEFSTLKTPFKKFIIAKICSAYVLAGFLTIKFVVFSILPWGLPEFINNILTILSCCSAFYISYKIINSHVYINDLFVLSMFMLALYFSMYLSFTINPPHFSLFKDENLQIYGIPSYKML